MKRYPVFMTILIFFLFILYTIVPCEAGAPVPVAPPRQTPPLPVSPPKSVSPPVFIMPTLIPIPKDQPPRNMQELAKMIFDLYSEDENGNYMPIRIVQSGPNEYLVMMAGTVGGQNANNWSSAFLSGLGFKGSYLEQIKSIVMELPSGAVVNFAGHSQGGMMGNQLAADPEVNEHLRVKSVITFGSPVNAEPQDTVIYKRYAAVGDPIPWLSNEFSDINPYSPNIFNTIEEIADLRQYIIWDTGNIGIGDNIFEISKTQHAVYSSSKELQSEVLPFEINQWRNSTFYDPEQATSTIPGLDKPLVGRQNAKQKYGATTGETRIEGGLEVTSDKRFPAEGIEKKISIGISKNYENALLYYGDDHHNSQFGYAKVGALAGYEREKDGAWSAGVGLKGEVALYKRHDDVGDVLSASNDLDIGTLKLELTPLEFQKSKNFTGLHVGVGVEAIAFEDTLVPLELKITPKVIYDYIIRPTGQLFGQKLGEAPDWLDHGLDFSVSLGGGLGVAAEAEANFGKTKKGYGWEFDAKVGKGLFASLGFNVSVI